MNFGNIRVTPFLDTWRNNELYRTLREGLVEKSCPSCFEKDGTRGGCRSTAFAFHGRWDAPDPFCSHLNEGQISVSCPNTCNRKVRNVRVRGVPEMAVCLVFTPNNPEIFTLNPSAWLILQLCDGRSEAQIAQAYLGAVEPALSPDEVASKVHRGLLSLVRNGIVEMAAP